jgi:endoglucanase
MTISVQKLATLAALIAVALLSALASTAAGAQCVTAGCQPPPPPPPQPQPQPAPAPAPAPPPDPRGIDPGAVNPLLGLNWYIDKAGAPAWREVRYLRSKGRDHDADLVMKIARNPQFKWWGRWAGTRNPSKALRWWLGRLDQQEPGAVPQLTVARHEGKQCNPHYQGGGRRGDAQYRAWIRNFAHVIGDRRVVIAYEPDSIGTIECLAKSRRKARIKMLRYGVDVLSKLPNATIYLEGGASDWEPPDKVAHKLRLIGISKVRGFMVNATHKDTTRHNIQHCRDVSRLVGGKHCIINTSHNGNGALHYRQWINRSAHLWRVINVWCNPRNEALGDQPSTQTADPVVDAYLWIERPGFSNGTCNGGPKTGAWWLDRALLLAKRAHWN